MPCATTPPTLLDTLPTEALEVYTAAGVPFGKGHAPVRIGLASFRLELHRGALVLARTLHAPWVPLRADGTAPTWRVAAASRLALDWVRAEMPRPA